MVGGKGLCLWSVDRPTPEIARIFVRGRTAATRGNASGIGMGHVTTPKLLDKIDWQVTAVNAPTAACPEDCRAPLTLVTERQAVASTLMTIRPHTPEDVRVVHSQNTLELHHIKVSKGCLPLLYGRPDISVDQRALPMTFDRSGDLIYPPVPAK